MLPVNENVTREMAALLEAYGYAFDPCVGIGLPTIADVGNAKFFIDSRKEDDSWTPIYVANAGAMLDPKSVGTKPWKGVGFSAELCGTGRVLVVRLEDGEFSPKRPLKATTVEELRTILDRFGAVSKPENAMTGSGETFNELYPVDWFKEPEPPKEEEGVTVGGYEMFWLYDIVAPNGDLLARVTCRKPDYDLWKDVEKEKLPAALKPLLKPFLGTAFAVFPFEWGFLGDYEASEPWGYRRKAEALLVYSPVKGVINPRVERVGYRYELRDDSKFAVAIFVKLTPDAVRSYVAANGSLPPEFGANGSTMVGKLYATVKGKREVVATMERGLFRVA